MKYAIPQMSKAEALRIDDEFYVDFDEEYGDWFVFGDSTGFAYSQHGSEREAERAAEKLSRMKSRMRAASLRRRKRFAAMSRRADGASKMEGILRRMKPEEAISADAKEVAKHHKTTEKKVKAVWDKLVKEGIIKKKGDEYVRTSKKTASTNSLLSRLIRIAHANPEARPKLLPIIEKEMMRKQASHPTPEGTWGAARTPRNALGLTPRGKRTRVRTLRQAYADDLTLEEAHMLLEKAKYAVSNLEYLLKQADSTYDLVRLGRDFSSFATDLEAAAQKLSSKALLGSRRMAGDLDKYYEIKIKAMQNDAAISGDQKIFKLCNRALKGDRRAWNKCVEIIEGSSVYASKTAGQYEQTMQFWRRNADKVDVGKFVRISWKDAGVLIEELPGKGQKRLGYYSANFGTIPHTQGSTLASYFMPINLKKDIRFSKGDTFEAAVKKLKGATEKIFEDMVAEHDWLTKKVLYRDLREKSGEVWYLKVAPGSADPITAGGKDFIVEVDWNNFKSYAPGSKGFADTSGEPDYTIVESKSSAQARKLYKILNNDPDALARLTWNEWVDKWLPKHKIQFKYHFSQWR